MKHTILAFNIQKSIMSFAVITVTSGCAWQHALETSSRLDCTTGYLAPQVIAQADRTVANCPQGDPRAWALYGKGGSRSTGTAVRTYITPSGNFTVQSGPAITVITR
jgi:hypothetical protein